MNECQHHAMNAKIMNLFGLSWDHSLDLLFNDLEIPQECGRGFMGNTFSATRDMGQRLQEGFNVKFMGLLDMNWEVHKIFFGNKSKPYGI